MPTWIRVRDTSTGHEFDIDARSLRAGMEPLDDQRYPDLSGPGKQPRPPKHFVGKGGEPAVPRAGQAAEKADLAAESTSSQAGTPAESTKKGRKP